MSRCAPSPPPAEWSMKVSSALLVGSLGAVLVGCSRPAPPGGPPVNPKPVPEAVTISRQFPLSGVTAGPLPAPRPPEPPPPTQAGRDLRAYYQDAKKEPAWKDAVRQLAAAEP